MKAVAVALVLIAGAAVVLWFGNTLNSWVLGGLIGGLAALLLSIPICLTLFAYLSRRHDEHLRVEAEAQEQEAMAYGYYAEGAPQARLVRRAYIEPSVIDSQAASLQEEKYRYVQDQYEQQQYAARHLPTPTSQRLPTTRQGQLPQRASASTRGGEGAVPKQQARNVPLMRTKDLTGRRTTRRMSYPGFAGYEPGSFHSQHRSAALRAARQEAAEQYDDVDVEIFPPNDSQRLPAPRRVSRSLREQQDKVERLPRSTRQFRRVVDATSSQGGSYPACILVYSRRRIGLLCAVPRSLRLRSTTTMNKDTYSPGSFLC